MGDPLYLKYLSIKKPLFKSFVLINKWFFNPFFPKFPISNSAYLQVSSDLSSFDTKFSNRSWKGEESYRLNLDYKLSLCLSMVYICKGYIEMVFFIQENLIKMSVG